MSASGRGRTASVGGALCSQRRVASVPVRWPGVGLVTVFSTSREHIRGAAGPQPV